MSVRAAIDEWKSEPGGDVHVYPLSEEGRHAYDSRACGCAPRIAQPCPACADEGPQRGCVDCGGAGVVDEYDTSAPAIVVHRDARGELLR